MNAITNLSRLNLSDEEVVKDMAFEFERCSQPAAFEAWARKWGAAIVGYARNGEAPDGFVEEQELKDAEESLKDVQTERDVLQSRINEAVTGIDAAMEGPANRLEAALDKVVAKLEAPSCADAEVAA